MIWKVRPGDIAEEHPQHGDVCGVEAVVPRGPLGIRRGDERRPGRVGLRGGVAVLQARGIAFHGRQKSKWYLSFQQLIAASAPPRFCSARSLALSAASRSFRAMSCRATSFQLRTGALCHHLAMYVCSVSPGRAGGSAEALDLVELRRPLRAVERRRWRAAELRRALDEERLHAAHPRGRIEDRLRRSR